MQIVVSEISREGITPGFMLRMFVIGAILGGLFFSGCAQPQKRIVAFQARAENTPAIYCGAPTKKNTACRNKVKTAGQRCHLHK
jgi:outer membrane murein-binding lipoprotein Lpp